MSKIITKKEIIEKIDSIPPLPEAVRRTIEALKNGDLQKAADWADSDIVLKNKIQRVVNSAYFGFTKKLTDTRQMFSAMGLEMAKSVVLSYMVGLLAPKEWKIFTKLNFEEFQIQFLASAKEAIILETDEQTYKRFADSIAIIPATICLIDELLGDKKTQIDLLLETTELNYGKILKRFTGHTLFSLAALVAKKWGLESDNIKVVKLAECLSCELDDEIILKVVATLHLEMFYLVSKPQFFMLNSFIDFNLKTTEIAVKNFKRKTDEE